MKYISFSLKVASIVLLFSALMPGAALYSQTNPEKIVSRASQYLRAFYTTDLAEAKKLASTESQEFLNEIQQLIDSRPLPDSIMELQKKIRIEVLESNLKIYEDSARLIYTLYLPAETGQKNYSQSLKMVKENGEWMVYYTEDVFQEQMKSQMEENEMEEE